MKKIMATTATWTALVLLVSAGTLLAHHSLSQFDTNTPITVKGAVVRFERVNPHSWIFVDEKLKNGQTRRWAVEGPAIIQLSRMGYADNAPFRIGEPIEVCGYALKEGIEQNRTINTEPISLSLKDTMPQTMTGRVLDAEMLVMPDGQKMPWGDYGHHKCLGPDFSDIHTR